jgi:AcrR family transcriptional regulator
MSPRKPAVLRNDSGRNLREHLIETAARLIDERGSAGLGVRDIAREAQVADGVLYNYFEDKEDLLARALLVHVASVMTSMPPMPPPGTGTLEENLRLFVDRGLAVLTRVMPAFAGLTSQPKVLQRFHALVGGDAAFGTATNPRNPAQPDPKDGRPGAATDASARSMAADAGPRGDDGGRGAAGGVGAATDAGAGLLGSAGPQGAVGGQSAAGGVGVDAGAGVLGRDAGPRGAGGGRSAAGGEGVGADAGAGVLGGAGSQGEGGGRGAAAGGVGADVGAGALGGAATRGVGGGRGAVGDTGSGDPGRDDVGSADSGSADSGSADSGAAEAGAAEAGAGEAGDSPIEDSEPRGSGPQGLPAILTQYLRAEHRLGRVSATADVDAASTLIVGAIHGQILPGAMLRPGQPVTIPPDFAERMVKTVLDGIAPRPSPA